MVSDFPHHKVKIKKKVKIKIKIKIKIAKIKITITIKINPCFREKSMSEEDRTTTSHCQCIPTSFHTS